MVALRVCLLLAAVTVAAFGSVRPAWAGGSDGPCLPASVECIQTPPAKIVVEIPAPEVVFKQAPCAPATPPAPPQTIVIEKHCGLLHWLFHGKKDKHHAHAPAYAPAAAPPYAPAAAPVMAMPVSYPVAAAPMMFAYPQPAYAMPMAMPSYGYPPPQAAPPSCAPYGSAAPPGYGAPPSNPAANAATLKLLQDLLALRSSNTTQAAPPAPAAGTPDATTAAAPPAGTDPTLASRVEDLWKRVDRLERIAVQQDERLKKLEPKPER